VIYNESNVIGFEEPLGDGRHNHVQSIQAHLIPTFLFSRGYKAIHFVAKATALT